MSTVVAIDGPAGAGKSTVARMAAQRLGYAYINTGSLYRAIAYAASASGITFPEITPGFLSTLHLEFRGADLLLNGTVLDSELRSAECAAGASIVAALPFVRDFLMPVQRNAAANQWIVMEGRDIGTVVFPDAERKFFVTASPEERARRRLAQSGEVGKNADFNAVLKQIIDRDERDSSRAVAPLKPSPDAIVIDTTGMPIAAVVAQIVRHCR